MKRSKKTLRLRGSRTCGKGPQTRTGKGGRGGTGNAGSFSHKYISKVLEEKKKIKNKKTICLRDLNERKDKLVKKGLLLKKETTKESVYYKTTEKFNRTYKKILGEGQLSFKLKVLKPTKVSLSAESKLKF